MMDIILGAGLSGLICGALNAKSTIFERNPSSLVSHRAVLRFRDNKIARSLGIDFRKVQVRKTVWYKHREVEPTPRFANWYSQKVRGVITDNSLWNVAPSERYIAPDDLHAVLADICGNRVKWDCEVSGPMIREHVERHHTVISTIPLPILLGLLKIESTLTFRHSPITVDRYKVRDSDVFQTVYFPDPDLCIYRATLTGHLLTLESIGHEIPAHEVERAMESFGVAAADCTQVLRTHKQSYGKIAPVPNTPRQNLLHRLTVQEGIYSLGRFATWRNILLDDVYEDIAAIRRMMGLEHYQQTLERTKS